MSDQLTDAQRQARLASAESTLWAMGISGLSCVIPPHLAMDIAVLIKEHRQLRIDVLRLSINKQLEKKWEHQQPLLDPSKDLDTQLKNCLDSDPKSS